MSSSSRSGCNAAQRRMTYRRPFEDTTQRRCLHRLHGYGVRDSGKFRGRRKLVKKGDSELRRLLFNAAMQGRRSALWEPYYLSLRQRGFGTTALRCIGQKARSSVFRFAEKSD